MLGEILVLGQALSYGIMNVIDAHIVKKHVQHLIAFAAVTGIVNILFAIPLFLIFWRQAPISATGFWIAALGGIFFGVQTMIYYFFVQKEDISHVLGLAYVYPIFGLLIGTLFFHEQIQAINYIGCIIAMIGIWLTVRRSVNKWRFAIPVIGLAAIIAVQEAIMNIATQSATHGISPYLAAPIQTFFMGLFLVVFLLSRKERKHLSVELKNIKYALLAEIFTIGAALLLVLSYQYLPYVRVSFISVSQVLFVVAIEKIWSKFNPTIMQDTDLLQKFGALITIAIGICLVLI